MIETDDQSLCEMSLMSSQNEFLKKKPNPVLASARLALGQELGAATWQDSELLGFQLEKHCVPGHRWGPSCLKGSHAPRGAVSLWAWMHVITIKAPETCGGNSLWVENYTPLPYPTSGNVFSGSEIKTVILLDDWNGRQHKCSALSNYPCLNLIKLKNAEKQAIDCNFLIDVRILLPLESTKVICPAETDVIPHPKSFLPNTED